jgi:hypothetical protein
MPKTKISEYSATANSNTDVGGINIDEGCAPSGINDAIRTMMAQLKNFQTGTGSDSFNGPVGSTTASTGAFTTLTTSSTVTHNGGTANGVAYLNGSKVLTTGSALVFDGTNLGVGTASPTAFSDRSITINGSTSSELHLTTVTTGSANGDGSSIGVTSASDLLLFNRENAGIRFGTNNTDTMRLDSSGNLGLGVTPSAWFSSAKVIQNSGGSLYTLNGNQLRISANSYQNTSNASTYYSTGFATEYRQNEASGVHQWFTAPSGTAGNAITFTQAMTLDASGNLGVGKTSPATRVDLLVSGTGTAFEGYQAGNGTTVFRLGVTGASYSYAGVGANETWLYSAGAGTITIGPDGAGLIKFINNNAERARIDSSGFLLVGTTSASTLVNGLWYSPGTGANTETQLALVNERTDGSGETFLINRQASDGILIQFRQANNTEGTISVSGTTVSYNGGHLARCTQLTSGVKDEFLLKGTVLSNLDDMCVYINTETNETSDNEQLNKVKVSEAEGDTNVAGVFVSWLRDEQHGVDEINMAMTGDMIIRIAQGTTIQRGDLLMSAGDGTAKPQGDDIVRAKTIAKVTSTHITCTYEDGSYCVPCVLMAC